MVADWLARHNLIEDNQEVEYARTIAWANAAIGINRIPLTATKSNAEDLVRHIVRSKQQQLQVKIEVGGKAKKARRKARSA